MNCPVLKTWWHLQLNTWVFFSCHSVWISFSLHFSSVSFFVSDLRVVSVNDIEKWSIHIWQCHLGVHSCVCSTWVFYIVFLSHYWSPRDNNYSLKCPFHIKKITPDNPFSLEFTKNQTQTKLDGRHYRLNVDEYKTSFCSRTYPVFIFTVGGIENSTIITVTRAWSRLIHTMHVKIVRWIMDEICTCRCFCKTQPVKSVLNGIILILNASGAENIMWHPGNLIPKVVCLFRLRKGKSHVSIIYRSEGCIYSIENYRFLFSMGFYYLEYNYSC